MRNTSPPAGKLHPRTETAIRIYNKLLIGFSEASLQSNG